MLLEDCAVGLERICCRWTGIRDLGVREASPGSAWKPLSSGMEGPACTWAGGVGVEAVPGKADTSSGR